MPSFFSRSTRSSNSRARSRCPDRISASLNVVRKATSLPFAATQSDVAFLTTFSDALMRSGHLERARELLERVLREKNEGMTQLFELADRYVAAGQDQKATEVLLALKRRMFADKRQNDFAALIDGVGAKYPHSQV